MRAISLLAALTLGIASCGGGPRFQRKICEQQYQDCTDACVDRCEPIGPADENRRPPMLDDNDIGASDCASCVSTCQRKASACEAAAPPVDDQ